MIAKQQRIGAILLMGGEGRRFGSTLPKQFHFLGEKRVYRHTLDILMKSQLFDEILLICHPDWISIVQEESPHLTVVAGGATRQQSCYLGLKGFINLPEIVLIHDAVRPFVTENILHQNILGAIQYGAVNTCIPSTDTLVYAPGNGPIKSIPNREDYLRGQTPQTFRVDWILEAHEKARNEGIENATDDCQLILNTARQVQIIKGDERNLKITSEFDLIIAEQMLSDSLNHA